MKIADLPDGTAESIEHAIRKYADDKSLDIAKLRGFGSDGASVMTGRHTGVATQLKAHTPRKILPFTVLIIDQL